MHVALVLLVVAAMAFVGHRAMTDAGGAPPAAAAPISLDDPASRTADRDAGAPVTVHVAGAVRRPGLYRLRTGARIDDAIRRAGGPSRRADLAALNLAAEAEDGRQVLVPERARAGAVAAAGATAAPDAPVNLNTATLEQLDTLDGVGPATAEKILEHREASGGFGSVDELDQIPGIGEKRLASLREQVTL
jgi:competence protein ComEA